MDNEMHTDERKLRLKQSKLATLIEITNKKNKALLSLISVKEYMQKHFC